MSIEEAARTELLRMRKSSDGVTVGALARTEALRQVLGGGDPRIAYNVLKHVVLSLSAREDLSIIAASYSLGFASDGRSHLDRLSDFGRDYAYDQRQARRYSDRGVVEIARRVATEYTIEASPDLQVVVVELRVDVMELLITTSRLPFVEMREPVFEVVSEDGTRVEVPLDWSEQDLLAYVTMAATCLVELTRTPAGTAVSVRWPGEIWPKFTVVTGPPRIGVGLTVETLASRVQIGLGP